MTAPSLAGSTAALPRSAPPLSSFLGSPPVGPPVVDTHAPLQSLHVLSSATNVKAQRPSLILYFIRFSLNYSTTSLSHWEAQTIVQVMVATNAPTHSPNTHPPPFSFPQMGRHVPTSGKSGRGEGVTIALHPLRILGWIGRSSGCHPKQEDSPRPIIPSFILGSPLPSLPTDPCFRSRFPFHTVILV